MHKAKKNVISFYSRRRRILKIKIYYSSNKRNMFFIKINFDIIPGPNNEVNIF